MCENNFSISTREGLIMTSYISCPRIQLHKTGRVEEQNKPESHGKRKQDKAKVQRYSIYLVSVGFVEHIETLRQNFSQHPVSADPIIKTITE